MPTLITHTFSDAEVAAISALRDVKGQPLDASVQAFADRHLQHQADFAVAQSPSLTSDVAAAPLDVQVAIRKLLDDAKAPKGK